MAIHTNRVFDAIDADLVEWNSQPDPDPTGATYPGSGVFGVNTSDYTVVRKLESSDNFSWKKVEVNNPITIPVNQQMLVHGGFEVCDEVNLFGEIILL